MSTSNPNSSATASSRPIVTLPATTHLDPGAYIRGSHPLTFGEHNLVHPRALLSTTSHPLNIGTNNIISERATIGGSPFSASNPPATTTVTSPEPHSSASPSLSGDPATPKIPPSDFTQPTILESHIHIHPSAYISHSSTIHSHSIIESHAVIHPGITIGAHSKICANVAVTSDVPDWTVVYGGGNQRRSRRPLLTQQQTDEEEEDPPAHAQAAAEAAWKRIENAENIRVKGMDREREATSIILRNAARAAAAAKRQSLTR